MLFHHNGIACEDIPSTLAEVRRMLPVRAVSEVVFDPLQKAELCMIELEGLPRIELVSGEMVQGLLAKGVSQYHVCYETEGLEQTVARFYDAGAFVVSPPRPAVLFGGRQVAFVQTAIGLVELLQAPVVSD